MANYTNTIPTKLNIGDVITINVAGNYVLPRGQFRIEVASARGGNGGRAMAWASLYGYLSGSSVHWGPSTSVIGEGGAGGSGIAAIFNAAFSNAQNALRVALGAVGTNGASAELAWTSGGSAAGGGGTTGGSSTLTANGVTLCNVSGGTGGGGGSVSASASSRYPTRDGEIVSRSASSRNGNPGSTGSIVAAPTGYTTAANSGAGYVKIAVLSLNSPPTEPKPCTYDTPMSAREILLNCGISTDPDGDAVRYIWEYRVDSGAWTQCAITTTNQARVTVPSSGTNITFRVKAADTHGAESAYATGSAKAIVYNFPPVISGADEDRGEIQAPFIYTYTVDDPDPADILTVNLYLDSTARLLETIDNAVRGQQYSFDFAPIAESVPMGRHTLIIHAKDDQGGEAYRRIAFTRYSNKLEVELAQPIKTKDLWATLITMLHHTSGNDYTMTCRVRNDPLAAWEDVTELVNQGNIYEFDNKTKSTAEDAEFFCQVDIEKGPSRNPIEFRGGTFVCNANGIEVSYARGTRVDTSQYPSLGVLGPEDTNVQIALNTLSLAASQAGLRIKDNYSSEAALRSAHPTGTAEDMYAVWDSTTEQWDLWVWSMSANDWRDIGPISGVRGKDGESAYQTWLNQNNTGTEQDFLNSLHGEDGKDAKFAAYYDTAAQLEAALPTGDDNLYLVGQDMLVYLWNNTAWVSAGTLKEKGDTGPRGSVWHRVNAAPTASNDVPESLVGDWAIDITTSDVYEKTGTTTWLLRLNIKGATGKKFAILGTHATLVELSNAVPSPEQGDMYNVGVEAPYTAYMWDNGQWVDQGTLQGPQGEPGATDAAGVSVDTTLLTRLLASVAGNAQSMFEALDGIIESGSNANGKYYKLGPILVCTIDSFIPTISTGNNIYSVWSFPAAFSSAPTVTGATSISGAASFMTGIATETQVNLIATIGHNTNTRISAMAWGLAAN